MQSKVSKIIASLILYSLAKINHKVPKITTNKPCKLFLNASAFAATTHTSTCPNHFILTLLVIETKTITHINPVIMKRLVELTYCFLALSLLVGQISSEEHNQASDLFQSTRLNISNLQTSSEIQKLNDLLVDRTFSTNSEENIDLVLEELILDYKNGIPPDSQRIQIKKLILALTTLKGENDCNHYGHTILLNNYLIYGKKVRFLRKNESLRRIERILLHYLNEHINHCEFVYLRKFEETSLDEILAKRLDIFLGKAIESLTSDKHPDNFGKKYVQILHNLVYSIGDLFEMTPAYIYNSMKNLVKGDADASFLRLVVNDRTGVLSIKKDKFVRLYNEYVVKPCELFETKLGPDVFEPALFDMMFYSDARGDQVNFYEALLKYRLCTFSGKISDKLGEVLYYANNQ